MAGLLLAGLLLAGMRCGDSGVLWRRRCGGVQWGDEVIMFFFCRYGWNLLRSGLVPVSNCLVPAVKWTLLDTLLTTMIVKKTCWLNSRRLTIRLDILCECTARFKAICADNVGSKNMALHRLRVAAATEAGLDPLPPH